MGWARFKTFVIQNWALIFFITALLVSILFIQPAHAAVILHNGDNIADFVEPFNAPEQIFYLATTTRIDSITETFSNAGPNSSGAYLKIFSLPDGNATSTHTFAASSSQITIHQNTEETFSFSGDGILYLYPGWFSISGFGASTPYIDVIYFGTYLPSPDYYSGGYAYQSGTVYPGLVFTINGDFYVPPAPPDQISITYPSDGSTVANLGFWGVDYKAATSTTYQAYVSPFYTIEITAGNTSSTFQGTLVGRKDLEITASGSTTSTQVIAVQGFIPGITYYAQGNLIFHAAWGDSGLLVATSSVISFTVSTTTFPGTFPSSTNPFPTSTISTSNVCDPNAFFLIYGICRLFVPQASDFVIFNIMSSYVQNKPPFGYIGLTTAALKNLGTASSTVQFPNLSGFAYVFDPIRTGLNSLFWVLFVFWLLSKFRNIEL